MKSLPMTRTAVPAFTVSAACASANVAIATAAESIALGGADIVIAGGAETLSDVPIRFGKKVRQRLIASQKAKGPGDYLALLGGLKPKDLAPDMPAIAEFSTGQTMGQSAERLAKRFGVTREAQDAFSLSSHQRAAAALAEGKLADQILPMAAAPGYEVIATDNGVRGDSSMEKLAKLPPVFDRQFGSVTAGNASFLTDGAAACLLMDQETARQRGFTPLARIAAMTIVALDPLEELLLGPALAIPRLLDAAGITLADVGVLELHEAFAAQMLANMAALADDKFCRERFGRAGAVGELDRDRLNLWGGSLSLGHPFGATGARLVTTAARRMVAENARWGLVAACAAGAIGHAMLLQRDV